MRLCGTTSVLYKVGRLGSFGSVYDGLWWAVVTLTTVGYGDIQPVTAGGRILATVAMFAGIGVIGSACGIMADALREAGEEENCSTCGTCDYCVDIGDCCPGCGRCSGCWTENCSECGQCDACVDIDRSTCSRCEGEAENEEDMWTVYFREEVGGWWNLLRRYGTWDPPGSDSAQ